MTQAQALVSYWDASAILSLLFQDLHSEQAASWVRQAGVHLLSSLAWAEVCAVISRIQRDGVLAPTLVEAARETLESGPWYRVNLVPEWEIVRDLSVKWSLRGADLWHLGAAKTLQKELPELTLATFDQRLRAAAMAEGLTPLEAGGP